VKERPNRSQRPGVPAAEVCIRKDYPVTVNDAQLTEAMLPTLERVAGAARVMMTPKITRLGRLLVLPAHRARAVLFVGVTPAGRNRAARRRTTRRCSGSTRPGSHSAVPCARAGGL